MEGTRLVIVEGLLIKDSQAFHFNQTMKLFSYLDMMRLLQELSGSLSYILCFTIYIYCVIILSTHCEKLSPITTVFSPQEHIRIDIWHSESLWGSQVLYSGLWILKFWVLGLGVPGSGVLFLDCLTEQLVFLHSCEWLLLIIYLINACDQKIRLVKNQIVTHHILYSEVKFKETRLVKLLPCFFKWLQGVVLRELQVPNALHYRFNVFSVATRINADQNGICFFSNYQQIFRNQTFF